MRKTKKAARQRFRVSKSGRIKMSRPGKSHLLASKSRARKRHLRKQTLVHDVDESRIRMLLPHS